MSTAAPEVKAINLGPIPEYAFKFDDYGVTVLHAANGSGKSILLNSMKLAAKGAGKLPLRIGAKKGSLELFGAIITIGGTTRHNGTFEVTNIEGRYDLAKLVNPGFKDEASNERERIKSLVQLMDVVASIDHFLADPAFADLQNIVDSESLATADLVEMADKIKKVYNTKAFEAERIAELESDRATAADAKAAHVNIDAEDDGDKLQAALELAVREETSIKQTADESRRQAESDKETKAALEEAKENYSGPTAVDAAAQEQVFINHVKDMQESVDDYRKLLEKAERDLAAAEHKKELATEIYGAALDHEALIAKWTESLAGARLGMPTEGELTAATQKVSDCRKAIEQGALIRDAKNEAKKAIEHKDAAKAQRTKAEHLRTAAKATDDVLSGVINTPLLKVDSSSGVTRVVADHPIRGKNTPYGELSEGEKWRIAMKIGIDAVGPGGLLVVDQVPFEGLDVNTRAIVHEEAKAGKVYVITAQATRDANEPEGMQAVHMDWQPMNLAPIDQAIEGRNEFGAVFPMMWSTVENAWINHVEGMIVEPTHWKWLPDSE